MSRPIGIDLGTSYSMVACVDEHGKPQALADEDQEILIPSAVLFEDDEVLVGTIAKESGAFSPERVVTCVKRYMGDPDWSFKHAGKAYSPEEISSFILRELRRIAEQELGTVGPAVVTVPAYFLDGARKATVRAAEMAGLEVLAIVNEPTAAAVSYGVLEEAVSQTLLVYDLGGGTFDVTILKTKGSSNFEVLGTQGNHRLGGTDWDQKICQHAAEQFHQRFGIDPLDDAMADYDLRVRAENAKITLSHTLSTRLVCQHAGKALTLQLTRDTLGELTRPLLDKTDVEVELALQNTGIGPDGLDLVLLVGGASKMPMVYELMKEKGRRIELSKHPSQCVALGAALEAARLVARRTAGSGLYKAPAGKLLEGIEVQDRTPHSLGMIALDGERPCNATIIPKGSTIPCELERSDFTTTTDNQNTLAIHLVQGETEDPEGCAPVASFDFKGIPPRKAGESQILVTFRYNENTVVEVFARDVKSGNDLSQEIRPLFDLRRTRERTVALLLDASGSMYGPELAEAKEATYRFIDETDFQHVRMGLVQFGKRSRASELHPLSANPDDLKKAARSLSASGSTPMAEAINCGRKMVDSGPEGAERIIVLFTDGFPDNSEAAKQAALRAKEAAIKMICVGVRNADTKLLDELASSSEDNFFAESGSRLTTTFENIARVISDRRLS